MRPGTLFEDHDKPINLNLGRIEGGDWASSVPAWCKVDCRISVLPGRSAREAMEEITQCVADFARQDPFLAHNPPTITFNDFVADGYVLEPGSDAEKILDGAHRSVNGFALESQLATAYLDSRVYASFDQIPALNYGCKADISQRALAP